jgi:hypothetical protein
MVQTWTKVSPNLEPLKGLLSLQRVRRVTDNDRVPISREFLEPDQSPKNPNEVGVRLAGGRF